MSTLTSSPTAETGPRFIPTPLNSHPPTAYRPNFPPRPHRPMSADGHIGMPGSSRLDALGPMQRSLSTGRMIGMTSSQTSPNPISRPVKRHSTPANLLLNNNVSLPLPVHNGDPAATRDHISNSVPNLSNLPPEVSSNSRTSSSLAHRTARHTSRSSNVVLFVVGDRRFDPQAQDSSDISSGTISS